MDDDYEKPDINLATISCHHGDNIKRVLENECSWHQTRSDGICVTDRPLQKDDSYEVTIQGTGRLLLGITSDLPCIQSIKDGQQPSVSVGNWYQIRLKEETEKMTVEYLDKKIWIYESSKERKSDHGIHIRDKKKHFIIVNALFGEMGIEIIPKDVKKSKSKVKRMKWWNTCGLNVLIQDSSTWFKLRYFNPLGFCALEQPIKTGRGFSVRVLETFGSWHYLYLGLSNKSPQAVQLNDWRIFYNNQHVEGKTPWPKHVVPFLKLKCPKQLMYFVWKGGNSIFYQEGNGEAQEVNFEGLDTLRPIYVFLEPFREHIQVDSRNILLEVSNCMQTLDSPIESDPDQTCMKEVTESSVSNIYDSVSDGPPAFRYGATAYLEERSDPQEISFDSFQLSSDQQNNRDSSYHGTTACGFQLSSDPQHNRDSGHHWSSDPQKPSPCGYQLSSDPQHNRAWGHHWSSDPQKPSACGFQLSSDPQHNRAWGHHWSSDPQKNKAGALQHDPEPEHRKIDFLRQNRQPQENTSSLSSQPTYSERFRDKSLPNTENNRPLATPPTHIASSKSLDPENNLECRPLPQRDDQNVCSPSSISIANENASLSKKNVLLEMLKENKKASIDIPNNDLSNEKQNKCVRSEAEIPVVKHGGQDSKNKSQSPGVAGTNSTSSPRNKIPAIPEDKVENHPQQNPNHISKENYEMKNFVRSATMPTFPNKSSHCCIHYMRAQSEHLSCTHQSNTSDHRDLRQPQSRTIQVQTDDEFSEGDTKTVRSDSTPTQTISSDQEEQNWKNCLQENYTFFIDRVESVTLADKLFEKKCLSDTEYENILKESARNSQCREIIKILKRKPHLKYDILHCLDLTEQRHIADRLRKHLSQ
ncbi:hypothetical protein LOTGIDRAFT_171525 [Lottia gigantea]|uniref:CARD domain-containing protein n=1 Tax=Lottia gigantea TaxID=225164 RepID=V4B799_LOTGI|nr:hypothetical protein LOTGIDRAFT_171525 [Lottia gigantea]ESP03426.1 hypothetical protein LOTGIDRAFT_171525 [Lottia gigantea]